MSSWFSDLSAQVGDLTTKVQAAIPIDKEMIEKLTLTTPEMTAERQKMEEEERKREQAKNSLAGMLPWETRDADREILVEECKEAILALSQEDDTFLGPYKMPSLPKTNVTDDADEEDDDEEVFKDIVPSKESLEKLSKLEPLPPLLADFDLDAHVGLIQRLLQVDTTLVEKQASLSGAGDRERTFWRNYFFHCAFTRYEAGLSIDEIWSDQQLPIVSSLSEHGLAGAHVVVDDGQQQHAEEIITFETSTEQASAASSTSTPLFDANREESSAGAGRATESASSGSNEGADYEMVGGADVDADTAELDELEAEIARELED